MVRLTIAAHCENNTKSINVIRGQNTDFLMLRHVLHMLCTVFWNVNNVLRNVGSTNDLPFLETKSEKNALVIVVVIASS
jgi:hypothetical protein